jgi:tRNA (mo5U34)-methyltransferase
LRNLTTTEASELVARRDFTWWQIFDLAPGVKTPGSNDIDAVLRRCGVPDDLSGASVLDIGTTNGGAAFIAERRGASRIVAADIFAEEWHGFNYLRDALDSSAEFVNASVYDLPDHPLIAGEKFDIVLFLGVLYHLRHPLLALDSLRRLTSGRAFLETAVCDWELPDGVLPAARFYRTDELNGDATNWFAPNMECLVDWCRSAGFAPVVHYQSPSLRPSRAALELTPEGSEPEWQRISYERPLRATTTTDSL